MDRIRAVATLARGFRARVTALRWMAARLRRWYGPAAAVAAFAAGASVHVATLEVDRARAAWQTSVTVVVAARPLPAGAVLAPGDVRTVTAPAALVPPGAVRGSSGGPAAAELRGLVTAHRIGQGEILTTDDVAAGSVPAALVGTGRRGVVVPGGADTAHLEAGTVVDLVVTASPDPLGLPTGDPSVLGRGVVVAAGEHLLVSVPADLAAAAAGAAARDALTLVVVGDAAP